jgi:hypothetical protein
MSTVAVPPVPATPLTMSTVAVPPVPATPLTMSTVAVPPVPATPSTPSTVAVPPVPASLPLSLPLPLPHLKETPFIFEEPKPSYFLLGHSEQVFLLSLGPLAPGRLIHIEHIHVVSQSLNKIQVTVARRLDLPHYQATMEQVKQTMHPSICYYQDDYAANSFLYVSCEHSEEVTRLLGTIDFEGIGSKLLLLKPSDSVRQSFFQDFGICSGQCQSRKGEPLGIAKPSGKPGSKGKELLVTCSKVLSAMGLRIFDFSQERLLKFAGELVAGNQIEAMRVAITDEYNLCGVHEDQKNDSDFPSVPVFS